jgi:two-component sensor histidine kinase
MTGEPQGASAPPAWIQGLSLFGEAASDILRRDWSQTELGAVETWPPALAALVQSTLGCPVAAALALGPRSRLICNARAARLLGQSGAALAGGDAVVAFSRVWPEAPQAFERAFAGELVSADAQALLAPGGGSVRADVSLAPLQGVDAMPACVQAQIVERPDDELAAALAESRRRNRNTLGILRSIARRTAEASESVESYAMHFEGRLDALARVVSLVAGSQSSGVPLDALVAEELFSFKAREDSALQISGPPVRIKPQAAEMLGLAVHELATNAMKFGALSPAGGKLEISWRLLGGEPNGLQLTWVESGVTLSRDAQQANGFGADLLKRGLAYALNARTEFVLRDGGLNCAIELPATVFLA